MQAKTLILNNIEDNSFKAIVNLRSVGKSNIKFFCKNNLPNNLALGIKQEKRIVKIPLNVCGNNGEFDVKDIDLAGKLLCAVVNVTNPFCPEILLSGSQNSLQTNSHIESAFIQTKPQDTSVLYEEESQNNIEELIDKNLVEDETTTYFDACSNCRYREAFYKEGGSVSYKETPKNNKINKDDFEKCNCFENQKIDTTNEYKNCQTQIANVNDETKMENKKNVETFEDEEKENVEKTFYEQVKSQIDALFNKYEPCEELGQIIPFSKWVKIVYDKDGNFYVLGLIFDGNGRVVYICYGMPSKDSSSPPDELENYSCFVPKNIAYPDKEGYFVVCQDGETGKTLKIDLI